MRIRCDSVFDGSAFLGPTELTVADGRITGVEPAQATGEPTETTPDEVRLPFVMPGLIDCHVHVTGYLEGIPAGRPFDPVKSFLRLCTMNGVTTVRDVGNNMETILYCRDWAQRYQGPRVLSSGPLLDAPPPTWPFSRMVRSADEASRHVDILAADGVDLVKIYRNVEPAATRHIVAAARRRGLPVAIHCGKTSAIQACEAGVTSCEHLAEVLEPSAEAHVQDGASRGDEAGLDRWSRVAADDVAVERVIDGFLRGGVTLVPTLLVTRRWADTSDMGRDPYLEYMSLVMPYHRHFRTMRNPLARLAGRRQMARAWGEGGGRITDSARRALDTMGHALRRFSDAGVPVAAGTDTPNPSVTPGFSVHQELALMIDAGLSVEQALRSATETAAALIGRPDLGRVRTGATADLIGLASAPRHDARPLQEVVWVAKEGQPVDLEGVKERVEAQMAAARG